MNSRKLPNSFAVWLISLSIFACLGSGCARIKGNPEDKSYLTPIPKATLKAYQYGQPVKTKLQAVIAAQLDTFHMDWTRPPTAIYTREMEYEEAQKKIEQPGTYSYVDPERRRAKVWLVVFEGEWTITEPLGTVTAPISGCTWVVVDAGDGSVIETVSGPNLCDTLNLEKSPGHNEY